MLGFGKKKVAVETAPLEAVQPASAINQNTVFFTMPKKFRLAPTVPFWTATKIWLIVGLTVALTLGGLYWWLVALAPVEPTPSAPDVSLNQPLTPINEPAPVINTPEITPPVNEPPAVEIPPAESTGTIILPKGADTDSDGLTDTEETLLGSNPTQFNSDSDSFPDGSEVLSGYNPNGPGKLVDAGLFKIFSSKQGYSFSYPAAWTVRVVTDAEDQIQLSIDANQSFSMATEPVASGTTISYWYTQKNPGLDPASVKTESLGNKTGIYSADRQTFFFIDPERPTLVITVHNQVGTTATINYPTIFEFLVGSFAFKKST